MQFEIKNRFSGEVQFRAEIECAEDAPVSLKIGLAVKWAIKTRANLAGAYLADADLAGATRQFKSDMWMTLTQNRAEVPMLIAALRDGKVNGSQYEGECACLVGTLALAKGVTYAALDHGANNPAEQWFAPIRPGDTPGKKTEGAFRARLALEWAEEWCALNRAPLEKARGT